MCLSKWACNGDKLMALACRRQKSSGVQAQAASSDVITLQHGSFALQELVTLGSSMAMVPLLMLTLPTQAQAMLDGRSKASRGHVSDTHTPAQILGTHKDSQEQLRLLRRTAWVLQVGCCSASKIWMRACLCLCLPVCTCLLVCIFISVLYLCVSAACLASRDLACDQYCV